MTVNPPVEQPIRLSPADLAALRHPADRRGLAGIALIFAGLCLALPPIGVEVSFLFVALIVLVAIVNGVYQAVVVANGVPLGLALGPAWDAEVDRLLAAVGRPTGSVRVVVITNPTPNAFATWRPGCRVIAVTSGLVALTSDSPLALRAVLAHELGHHIYAHVPPLLLFSGVSMLPAVTGPIYWALTGCRLWWQRQGERSADRLALVLTGSPQVTLQMLIALHQGSMPSPPLVAAIVRQSLDFRGGLRVMLLMGQLLSSHPFLGARCESLLQFALAAERMSWWQPSLADRWWRELGELAPSPHNVAGREPVLSGYQPPSED